jgi:hypothetical protein
VWSTWPWISAFSATSSSIAKGYDYVLVNVLPEHDATPSGRLVTWNLHPNHNGKTACYACTFHQILPFLLALLVFILCGWLAAIQLSRNLNSTARSFFFLRVFLVLASTRPSIVFRGVVVTLCIYIICLHIRLQPAIVWICNACVCRSILRVLFYYWKWISLTCTCFKWSLLC